MNFSVSAIKLFEILEHLFKGDLSYNKIADKFSYNNFLFYLNTLKDNGLMLNISNNGKKSYSLKTFVNFLNLDEKELHLLSEIKTILAKNATVNDVMNFNLMLQNLLMYSDENVYKELKKIISQPPFGLDLHDMIKEIDFFIKHEKQLLVTYNSPISGKNFFEVIPQKMKIENLKLYLSCFDNNLQETRYLKAERISNIKEAEIKNNQPFCDNFAICKFFNVSPYIISESFSHEIICISEECTICKIHFNNKFNFFQKVLSFGTNCKITEPLNLQHEFIEKIKTIKENYACENQ